MLPVPLHACTQGRFIAFRLGIESRIGSGISEQLIKVVVTGSRVYMQIRFVKLLGGFLCNVAL